MNKTLFALLAAIVALAVVAAISFSGRDADQQESQRGELLYPDLNEQLASVIKMKIATANSAETITLELKDERWTLVERDGYVVEVDKMRGALRQLAAAKIVESKTSNPKYYERLGLVSLDDESSTAKLLQLSTGDGDLVVDLLLGDRSNTGGETGTYVRRNGEQQSWFISDQFDLYTDPARWLSKDLLSIDAKRIQEIRIRHDDGEEVVVSKGDAGQANFAVRNVPGDRELLYPSVGNSPAGLLSNLQLKDVKPVAEVDFSAHEPVNGTFQLFDGTTIGVTAIKVDTKYHAKFDVGFDASAAAADEAASDGTDSSSAEPASSAAAEAQALNTRLSPWAFEIDPYKYQMLAKRMDDFLKALPESVETDSNGTEIGDPVSGGD